MDAVKFLNSRRRTCDSYPGCNGCEWKGKPCPGYVTYNPIFATHDERVKPNENVVKKEGVEKEMDAVKFIEERDRMCKAHAGCTDCPAYDDGFCGFGVTVTGREVIEQVEIVKEWSAAHPRKTRQDVFLEQWPNAKIIPDTNTLDVYPCVIEPTMQNTGRCVNQSCVDCRREFWSQEVE